MISRSPTPAYRVKSNFERFSSECNQASTKLIVFEWPYPVFRYLKREITEEQLLALATDSDKLTEAHTYIGLDLSLDGKRQEALPHLDWVRENGNKNFVEYPLALAEIERIKAKGN